MNNNLEFENEDPHPDSVEDNHPRTNYGNKPCTHEIVQEAMRIVSKDVISPKYVRNMNKIPTFEEYRQYLFKNKKPFYTNKSDAQSLIEFTKLHVKQALLEASEKAAIKSTKDGFIEVDKQSIINAYDLNNIK